MAKRQKHYWAINQGRDDPDWLFTWDAQEAERFKRAKFWVFRIPGEVLPAQIIDMGFDAILKQCKPVKTKIKREAA